MIHASHRYLYLVGIVSAWLSFLVQSPASAQTTYALLMSASSNRSSPVALSNRSVSGNIYVIASPDSNVSQVVFFLDDPDMSGPPRQTESLKPYDFAGGSTSQANPFNTTTVTDGAHSISTRVTTGGGETQVIMATFTVDNNPIQATLTWTTVAPSPIARLEAQGVTVSNKLYVFGGLVDGALTATKRSDMYDSSTNTWRRIADLPELITHAAVVVDGQSIYLIGGYVGNSPGVSTSHVWRYSIPNNTWSAAPPLPAIRGAGAAVRLGRNLHYFGGAVRTASQPVGVDRGNHYRLSLDGGTAWSSLAPLPNPRNHLGGATDGVVIYAVGGQHGEDEDNGNDAQVDIYDPRTGTWIRTTDLPRPRGHISSSTFFKDGYIFVVGGAFNDFQPSADVTAYDPVSAKWLTLPPLPQTRKTPVAGPIGSRIFSSTGNAGSGASPSKTTYRSSPFTMSTPGSE